MKRVMVIGGPGTGKSTFAKALGAKTGLPVYHTDFYYHDPKYDFYNDKTGWHAHMSKIAAKDSWIIDGNSARSMDERMERSEIIFYFDLAPPVALASVIKRRFSAVRKQRNEMPDGWKDKLTFKFLRYTWHYRKKYGPGVHEMLANHPDKEIIIFKTRKDAEDYLIVL